HTTQQGSNGQGADATLKRSQYQWLAASLLIGSSSSSLEQLYTHSLWTPPQPAMGPDARHAGGESALLRGGMTRGEIRWRVIHSLPKRHENHIFEAIRRRCAEYLAKQSFVITEGELVSQVWIKLMAGVSVASDE